MDLTQLAQLSRLLDREAAGGEALVAALDAEQAALTGTDLAALEAATRDKDRLAHALDALEQERRSFLAARGFGPGNAEMARLIRSVEDANYRDDARRVGPLATRWRKVVAVIRRCRADNQRNGHIVGAQMRRVTQTVNLLRTGRTDQLVYGRAGHQRYASAARALGRA
jgi:flagella synthesis protein FlgN